MDRETLPDPAVRRALARFTALKIDARKERQLAARYGIPGVPTILLFDGAGRERRDLRAVGFQTARQLAALLGKVP
jgi:thiol:disulfide interchange protein DsbD